MAGERIEPEVDMSEGRHDDGLSDPERRIAELERVLANTWSETNRRLSEADREARAERRARAEIEKELERTHEEVERTGAELARTKEHLGRAKAEVKPRAARKLERASHAAAEARAERDRERAEREELQRRTAALEKLLAAREVRIERLERQLVNAREEHVEARKVRRRAPKARPFSPPVGAAEAPEGQAASGGEDTLPARRRRFRVLLARAQRRREVRAGGCSVCQRPLPEATAQEAKDAGWVLVAGEALCSDCHRRGWRLAEETSLPFRRLADTASVGGR